MNLLLYNLYRCAILFVLLIMHLPVQAASFDCTTAQTVVEKNICSQPSLSKLDDKLNAMYHIVIHGSTRISSVKNEQRNWLKDRNRCQTVNCIRDAYVRRIDELAEMQVNNSADNSTKMRQAMARHDGDENSDLSDYKFKYALVDLNGDGIKDAVIYLSSNEWCGTGGCTMRILKGTKSGFSFLSGTLRVFPPIKVLIFKAHGWKSLAIGLRSGGLGILKFNGRRYPLSPPDDSAKKAELHGALTLISP